MDIAYDHIQEEVLSPNEAAKKAAEDRQKEGNLNAEFQEAYKSFSASPWGAKLGGFFSDVKKQGETYYEGARQEATTASGEALKGFTDLRSTLVSRARSMSTGQNPPGATAAATKDEKPEEAEAKDRSESEALRESEGVISRFRSEAVKRLKDLEKAEEAADAAIFKFGANIGNFLREAVTIAPPTDETNADGSRKVLFESKDTDGKRVIHTTRFDAQLHAIHSSIESFTKDPVSPEYESWQKDFDVEKKTDAIATDLEKYEELRRTMEKLVPEKVEYPAFWTRYYFLRMVIETEEQRRREMLKGAAMSPTENIGWDDDSDDDQPSTPQQPGSTTPSAKQAPTNTASSQTSSAIAKDNEAEEAATSNTTTPEASLLKPTESRRSEDMTSQPGSDASYDLVSGATSRAPGSPKDAKGGDKGEEDEEEDWE